MNKYFLVDVFRGTTVLKKFKEISGAKQLSREQVLKVQKRNLIRLLIHLKNNNPYYSQFLKGFKESDIEACPEEVLFSLPFSTKETMRENFSQIYNSAGKNRMQMKQTGGSTGAPFTYYLNHESISYIWSFVYLFWNKYAGYYPGDRIVCIAGNSFHSNRQKIVEYFYYKFHNNYFIKADVITPDLQIDYKTASTAKLIYGYPSIINLVLEEFPELIRRMKNLRAIFTTSELLLPGLRESIEKNSHVMVYDLYGANDGCVTSSECHLHNGYHYSMFSSYVESIKNENDQNELVITSLFNYDYPFVRYRVGDQGMLDPEPCTCGNPFVKITGLKGRTRDMIVQKNKRFIHGSLLNSLVFRYPEIKLYKIIQEKDYSVEFKLSVEPSELFDPIGEKLKADFSSMFSDLPVSISRLKVNEPTADKFKYIESRVI